MRESPELLVRLQDMLDRKDQLQFKTIKATLIAEFGEEVWATTAQASAQYRRG